MTDEVRSIVPVTGIEGLERMAEYISKGGTYEIYGIKTKDVIKPLAETEVWRLYVAKGPSGQIGLMKINSPGSSNYQGLKKEVRIFRTFQIVASEIDEAAEGPNKPFHGANFPTVQEKLEPDTQQLVVFLGYHPSITTYRQLVPLSVALTNVRVDLQTGAWILGKLLKILAFVHNLGFTVGFMDASNVFIEKQRHGVLILDLTAANEYPTKDEQLAEVAAAARIIWKAVGGTGKSDPPHDKDIMSAEAHAEFVSHLRRMIVGGALGAADEHQMIYATDEGLADRTWPKVPKSDDDSTMKRQFHEFVTY